MDPISQDIILGIVANGLTELIACFGRKGREFIVGKEVFEKMRREETALQPILQRAAEAVAEDIEWNGLPRVEQVCLFLTSPEVETIVRQIYSAKLSKVKGQSSLKLIRREFLTSFSLYVGLAEDRLLDAAGLLFDALIEGCDHALGIAIDDEILSAHEAKSAFRHHIVLDELAAIQSSLTFLAAPHELNLQEILEFEERYRQQVGSRHGYIIPPHFDVARKIPIDELYVCPSFVTTPKRKDREPEALKIQDFLSVIYRIVLLGNPGGGKSTFAFKLCHDLATQYSERLFAGRQVTPILVVLRDYGAEKKARNCSILQFIEATANSKYQVQAPSSAFEYLLLNGHTIVIFDGLDELLDTSYRQEVSNDIESFCTLYPSVPVVITSREVGYEQAPLDEKRFEVFHLADFNEDQVRDYVKKWFSADMDLMPDQQTQKAEAFLEESEIVPDLRSNPLMLALMCNIYRGENYIPRNRPDVYEKCTVMLFERWDKSRGIHVPLPIEAHIRPAMMYLAHWIYADETLQGGVTEESLIAKASEYLCQRRFEDRDEAERAAREFIEFCRGRAWVFTDTGTRKEGERLYQFTHRTFLEYFTAAYLVRTHPTPNQLGDALLPRITKREWDVVAQLAFQLQNKNVEGAGDELLSMLIEQAQATEDGTEWNLLSFAARCLEFIVPSPRVTRVISTACVERCLTWSVFKQREQPKSFERELRYVESSEPAGLLCNLLSAATENRATVADSVEKWLVARINSGSESDSLLASEIGLNFTSALYYGPGRFPQREVQDSWVAVSDRIFQACCDRIGALCRKCFWLCVRAVWKGKVPIASLSEWHGIEGIFREHSLTMFPRTEWISTAEWLLSSVLRAPYSERSAYFENALPYLGEMGRVLLSSPPPWVQSDLGRFPIWALREERLQDERPRESLTLNPDAYFGIFVLFVVMLEAVEVSEKPESFLELTRGIKNSRLRLFDSIRWALLARFEQVDMGDVQAEMNHCGFTLEQQAFAWRWIRREVDLVRRTVRKGRKSRKDSSGVGETDGR